MQPCLHTRLKFVVIGDVATGKTTVTERILHPDNVTTVGRTMPTVGMNCDMKHIDDRRYGRIDLLLVDTAGDDRFNGAALTQMYYKNAHGFLVLFDITNEQSFHNVTQIWLPRVRAVMDPTAVCCFCLVGNKTDRAAERRVSSEDALQLAISYGWPYIELSARETSAEEMMTPFMLLIVPLVEAGVGRVDEAEEQRRLRLTQNESAARSGGAACCQD